jgi:hypothetical protein
MINYTCRQVPVACRHLIDKQEQQRQNNADCCQYRPPPGDTVFTFYKEKTRDRNQDQGNTKYIAEVLPPSAGVVMQKVHLVEKRSLADSFYGTLAGICINPY